MGRRVGTVPSWLFFSTMVLGRAGMEAELSLCFSASILWATQEELKQNVRFHLFYCNLFRWEGFKHSLKEFPWLLTQTRGFGELKVFKNTHFIWILFSLMWENTNSRNLKDSIETQTEKEKLCSLFIARSECDILKNCKLNRGDVCPNFKRNL